MQVLDSRLTIKRFRVGQNLRSFLFKMLKAQQWSSFVEISCKWVMSIRLATAATGMNSFFM